MKKNLFLTICCVLLFLSTSNSADGQRAADLPTQNITIKMEKQPLGLVLRYLMEKYQVPVGFEESKLDRDNSDYDFSTNLPSAANGNMATADGTAQLEIEVAAYFEAEKNPITVNVVNGTLNDVFDQIVPQMENYKWEVNDGVVNIYPSVGRDMRFEELLNTEIEHFDLSDGATVNDISLEILKLPEYGKWASINKLRFSPFRQGSVILIDAQYGRKIRSEIHLSSITFRALLNEITKIKGGGWRLRWVGFDKSGNEHFDLDI